MAWPAVAVEVTWKRSSEGNRPRRLGVCCENQQRATATFNHSGDDRGSATIEQKPHTLLRVIMAMMAFTATLLRRDGDEERAPGKSTVATAFANPAPLVAKLVGVGLASALVSRVEGTPSRLCLLRMRALRRIRSSALAMSRAYDDAVGAYSDDAPFRGDSGDVEGTRGTESVARGGVVKYRWASEVEDAMAAPAGFREELPVLPPEPSWDSSG